MHRRRKTKTGCITCKIRRIKCSEEKPRCARCTSTGRKCEYQPLESKASFNDEFGLPCPAGSQPTDLLPSGQLERRAFEFYFNYVGPSISGSSANGFWCGTVLQVCRTEPLVWDAIISLSALYELMSTLGSTDGPQAQRNKQQAIMWYQRSLTTMRDKIQQGVTDLFVALITCTLFLAIEVLQSNTSAAVKLYYQGMQLVANSFGLPDSALPKSRILTDVAPVILQMGTSSLMREESRLAQRMDTLYGVEVEFSTLVEARKVLYAIISSWRHFDREVDNSVHQMRRTETEVHLSNSIESYEHLEKWQQEIEQRLMCWREKFCSLPAVIKYISRRTNTQESKTRQETDTVIAIIFMTWTVALILTKTKLNNDEMGYDLYEDSFEEIVDHATIALVDATKRAPFTFDMGIGLHLFTTALKCRNYTVRQKALSYLHQATTLQGMYNCSAAAQIATAIIALEQGSAMTPPVSNPSLEEHKDNQPFTGETHVQIKSSSMTKERRIREFTLSSRNSDNNKPQNGTTWMNFTYYLQETHTNDAKERNSIRELARDNVPLPDRFSLCEYQLVLDYYRSFRSSGTSHVEDQFSLVC